MRQLIISFVFREIIISVKPTGSACPTGQHRVQASAPGTLTNYGVKKTKSTNEAPDWGLIIGKSAVYGFNLEC